MAAPRIRIHPPLSPAALTRPVADPPPFPLERPHLLVSDARTAFAAAARAAGLVPGDVVLVPTALHPRRVDALRLAGLEPLEHPGLFPSSAEVDALLGPRVRALVLVHHLGFPQDGSAWRSWCDERSLLLIEDASDALLAWTPAGPAGAHGHATVLALGPTLGLPGALVAIRDAGREAVSRSGGVRLAAIAQLLPRALDPVAQGRRRGHQQVLADALGDRVPPPFTEPPEGAAPLVLPYEVDDPRATIARLRALGIEAVEPWGGRGPRAVGLPVHQRLSVDDLGRVALAARTADGSRAGSPRRHALALEVLDGLGAAEPVWRTLAERCGNVFSTFEWAEAWTRRLGDAAQVLSLVVRDRSRDVALVPLVRERNGPLEVLRLLGHGPGDRLGPVCARADLPAAAWGLHRALPDLRADLFLGEALACEDGWAGMIGATPVTRQASPVLDISGVDWDAFLAARSRNFRDQVRRRERNLRRSHEVTFRLADDPSRLDTDLQTLFALHTARWRGTTRTFAGAGQAFQRDFAHRALERGWLRLWFLEVDGRAVAAWEGFRYAASEWYYQAGREPTWDRESVGFVLLVHTVREAIADGMTAYRLLLGGEEFKSRFSTHDPGLETAVVPLTALGRAALMAGMAVSRMPAQHRRRVGRLLRRARE